MAQWSILELARAFCASLSSGNDCSTSKSTVKLLLAMGQVEISIYDRQKRKVTYNSLAFSKKVPPVLRAKAEVLLKWVIPLFLRVCTTSSSDTY